MFCEMSSDVMRFQSDFFYALIFKNVNVAINPVHVCRQFRHIIMKLVYGSKDIVSKADKESDLQTMGIYSF